jgi:hypothetical protein
MKKERLCFISPFFLVKTKEDKSVDAWRRPKFLEPKPNADPKVEGHGDRRFERQTENSGRSGRTT